MKKKILIVVALFFLPIAMYAYDYVTIGSFRYGLSDTDRTATIVSYYGYQTDISIPQYAIYNNITYEVTRIDNGAFFYNTDITSVSIPEGVKIIGANAFAGCTNLATIIIPSSIEEVGMDAFTYTPWFHQLSLNACGQPIYIGTSLYDAGEFSGDYDENGRPCFVVADGTTYISGYAFSSSSYETVEIPGSVKTIESYAFDGNSYITSIIIHEGVEEIGSWGFRNCSNLESIFIPNSLKEIGSDVFEGTSWYDSQDDDVVYAGKIAYKYKGVMPVNTEITLMNGTTSIAYCAFSGYTNLKSITIPNSVTSIGRLAFAGCEGLAFASIGNGVSSIGAECFSGCSSLKTVNISDIVAWCNISFERGERYGNHYYKSNPLYNGATLKLNNAAVTKLEIPQGISEIKEGAFVGCNSIKTIVIPSSVTVIGENALYLPQLESVFCYADDVPSTHINAFDGVEYIYLYVPQSAIADYSSSSPWNHFKVITDLNKRITYIGNSGIATYCSEFDLDFTETAVKAYIVSAFTPRTGKVILTRVYDVPARTGIVVMGDAGEHQIPVVEAQTVMSNMLVGVTEATELNKVDGDYTNYVFAQKNGELGFYAVTDGSTLGAHKAYLPLPTAKLPSADSRVAYMFDGDDATEIQNIGQEDNVQHSIYNLNGQRQKGLKKGLNIVDGKKMLIK